MTARPARSGAGDAGRNRGGPGRVGFEKPSEGPEASPLDGFRPRLEETRRGIQKLFLDFDGASVDVGIFFQDPSGTETQLDPMSSFLSRWGLTAEDEDEVIDSIVANVEENRAVDVAIIDVHWNGVWEGVRIATLADAYEVDVAPHNYTGHLASLISAHFCAAVPNFRIMEIEIDDVPWKDELVTHVPMIENGELVLSDRPGWGTEVNEKAVQKYAPTTAF